MKFDKQEELQEDSKKELVLEELKLKYDEEAPVFRASNTSSKQTVRMFESIFKNIQNHKQSGKSVIATMLAGEPGTGKTARIKLLSKVLGLNLVVIEAPHLVEEHIINIPYLIFNTVTGQEGHDIEVFMADSHLLSTLQKLSNKDSDAVYLKKLYAQSDDVISIYEQLGGTETVIPKIIQTVRKQYSTILFLDEFLRKINPRIRNMLRGILDGKIGNDPFPKDVYPIYATNVEDEGLDDIPKNVEFNQITLENPSKKEWFSYFVKKYQKSKTVHLNMKVINEFYHELEDDHMSFMSNDIRTSPRRWEQLLLYINSSIDSIHTEQDAVNLLTNVKVNFFNYNYKRLGMSKSESHSDLADNVLDLVSKLIEKETNFKVNKNGVNLISDWRETLDHQIKQKIKLGDARSYVPVVSGLPGIGKTAQAGFVAKTNNLRFIDINVATLNAEDTTGLTHAKERRDDKGNRTSIETTFSLPVLYTQIMKKIKEEDEAYFAELAKDPDTEKEKLAAYKKQPFKYLIFLDELNRNSPKVFNSIRRVLLEKDFGIDEKDPSKTLALPKECIMMAAINPDDEGAQELTKHMQDVLDIIESGPSWEKTLDHLATAKMSDISQDAHDEAVDILKMFVEQNQIKDADPDFEKEASEIPHVEKPYFIKISKSNLVYCSPRRYTNVVFMLARTIDNEYEKISKMKFSDDNEERKQQQKEIIEDLGEKVALDFKEGLQFNFTKEKILDTKGYWEKVLSWVLHHDKIKFNSLFSKDIVDTKSLSFEELFDDAFEGNANNLHEDTVFTNYLSHTPEGTVGQAIRDAIITKIKDRASLEKYVLDQSHPAKVYNEKTKQVEEDPNKKVCLFTNLVRLVGIACKVNNLPAGYFTAFFKNARPFLSQILGPGSEKYVKRLYTSDNKSEALDEHYHNTDHFAKPGQSMAEFADDIQNYFVETDSPEFVYGFDSSDYNDLIK